MLPGRLGRLYPATRPARRRRGELVQAGRLRPDRRRFAERAGRSRLLLLWAIAVSAISGWTTVTCGHLCRAGLAWRAALVGKFLALFVVQFEPVWRCVQHEGFFAVGRRGQADGFFVDTII